MFTGIVREVGEVIKIDQSGDTRIRLGCQRASDTIEIGASIACNGVCLTVVGKGTTASGSWFDVDASGETRSKTTIGGWGAGTKVNLEPAMRLGDELGGHIVSGHVDGLGEIVSVTPDGDSHRVVIAAPKSLGRFIASKGSVTVDGISLTVNEVRDSDAATEFGINIIPHTWQVTNLTGSSPGKKVNLEIDLLARYVARLAEAQ